MATATQREPMQDAALGSFYAGILDRFTTIVGESAGYATIHFAAMQQGLEAGRSARSDDAAGAIALLANGLEHDAELRMDGGTPTIHLAACQALAHGSRTLDGVLIGFYEGVWRGLTGSVVEGELTSRDGGSGVLALKKKVSP